MKTFILTLFLLLLSHNILGQQFWQNKLKNNPVFIENGGQISENKLSEEILFSTEIDGIELFFTNKGYFYKIKEYIPMSEEEIENREEKNKKGEKKVKDEREKEVEKNRFKKLNVHYVEVNWLNLNPNCKIIATEKQESYYTFPNISTKISAYKKITYVNLYENIDVEFLFETGKKGFKYNYILKAGADVSKIKLLYDNVFNIKKNTAGHLLINTQWGEFVEHVPISFDNKGNFFKVSYEINDKEVNLRASGKFQDQILKSPITIDPWVTVPNIPNEKKLFEIGKDSLDNVYVFGATSNATVQKYNSIGTLQWTYNSGFDGTGFFGDMQVHPNGKAYFTWVSGVFELNNTGFLTWSDNNLNLFGENWRSSFNCDFSKLIVAICSGSSALQTIDMNSHTISPIIETFPMNGEIRALTKGLNGKFYGLTINESPQIINLDYDLTPLYSLESRQQFNYAEMTYNLWGGKNAIAANQSYIYTYDGLKLSKRNIATGEVIDSTTISGGIVEFNSGVDVDNCGNVYVGSQSKIYKLNSDLEVLSEINTNQAVYDLCLGPNGGIYACGNNFIGLFDFQSCGASTCSCLSTSSTNASCFGGNQGTATIITNGGVGPFDYLWDDGQTTQTATGLSLGEHQFTVTAEGGCSVSGTALITSVNLDITQIQHVSYDTVNCTSNDDGFIYLDVSEGSGPYNFDWTPDINQNNDSVIGISTGNYTAIVTDNYGCKDTINTTLIGNNIAQIIYSIDSLSCQKYIYLSILNISYDSIFNYNVSWSNGSTDFTIPITGNGTYSYTVTNPNIDCILGAQDSIVISNFSTEDIWYFNSILVDKTCSGINAISFDVSDQTNIAYEIYDSFGNMNFIFANDTSLVFNSDTLITIYAYDFNFCKDTMIFISSQNTLNASIAGCNTIICPGDSCQLILNGAANFTWLDSPFLSSISNDTTYAFPVVSDTFYVVVNESNCSDTLSYFVEVSQIPVATIEHGNLNCLTDTVNLFANSPGNQVSWIYNGNTYNQNPLSATNSGNYNAFITNQDNCTSTYSTSVIQETAPISSFTCNPNQGEIPLLVNFTNTSQNATSYQWSFGNNQFSQDVNPNSNYLINGSYVVELIAFNNLNCSDTSYQTIIALEDLSCTGLTLIIPNVFTVNNDLINEHFKITAVGSYEMDFKCFILNRWGEIVKEMTNINDTWEGKNKTGKMCEAGVYFYSIEILCKGNLKKYDGFIHLVR